MQGGILGALIERLFYKRGGSQLLVIGIEVPKSVLRYNSNSGKTNDYEVTFIWLRGGEHHSVYKKSVIKRLSLKSTNQI